MTSNVQLINGPYAKVGLPRSLRVPDPNNPSSLAAGLWVGDGPPPAYVVGAVPGHEYLDALSGILYILEADMLSWTPIADIKGPPGTSTLSDQERQAIIDAASLEASEDLEPPVNLVVLFDNALEGNP